MNSLVRQSALLFSFNLLAGFANYLFLLFMAQHLHAAELGVVSADLAFYSLIAALATIAQYWAVFGNVERLPRSLILAGSLISMGLAAGTNRLFPGMANFAVLMWGMPALICLMFFMGRLQRAQAFVAFGFLALIQSLAKVAFSWGSRSSAAFVSAVPLSVGLNLLIALLLIWRLIWRRSGISERSSAESGWRPALVTAVAFAWLPTFDLIYVRYLLGQIEAGSLARFQLFSKILFFGPLTLLQVTLPRYVSLFRGEKSPASLTSLWRIEAVGLAASYLGALVFGWIGPAVAEKWLNLVGLRSSPILWCCLSAVPLYGLLGAIQVAAASGRITRAAAWIGATVFSVIAVKTLGIRSLDHYLLLSAVVNTALGIAATLDIRRLVKKIAAPN